MVRFHNFPQYLPWSEALLPVLYGVDASAKSTQSIDQVEEPAPSPDIFIKARVAIGQDIETGGFLVVDIGADSIDILLTVIPIA